MLLGIMIFGFESLWPSWVCWGFLVEFFVHLFGVFLFSLLRNRYFIVCTGNKKVAI